MFGSRQDREEVVCIACGDALTRGDAREYDKEGNRWNRQNKRFEYLCKACYRELDHQPRADLEETLVAVERAVREEPAAGAEQPARREFLSQYFDRVGDSDDDPAADRDQNRE